VIDVMITTITNVASTLNTRTMVMLATTKNNSDVGCQRVDEDDQGS